MSFDVVFIGETNDGKTTIVSSLMEDEDAVIGPIPGTTKVAHGHRLPDRKGNLILRAWDTPGFEETDDLHAWFVEKSRATGQGLIDAFIQAHAADPRWDRDLELLRPISRGALVVYVAASNRKPQSTDQKQLEVIRLAGANRIALINKRPGKDYSSQWNEVLKREIGIVRTYAPFTAGIDQRLELLDKLADCSDESREQIETARDILKADWEDRIDQLVRLMMATVFKAVNTRAVSSRDRESAERKLGDLLQRHETLFRGEAQKEFKHTHLRFKADFFNADVTSVEFWKMQGLGMTRQNALLYGTATGAFVGVGIDVMFAGLASGMPTLIGAGVGGLGAIAFAFNPYTSRKYGKTNYEARVQLKSQTLNVLLDRMIIFSKCLLRVSHGMRLKEAIPLEISGEKAPGSKRLSTVNSWNSSRIKAWGNLVGKMSRPGASMVYLEEDNSEDFQCVLEALKESLDSAEEPLPRALERLE